MELAYDLGYYARCFPAALKDKYGTTFTNGFAEVERRFDEVRAGREITVDDVMSIFDAELPFVRDWTKPDRQELIGKINKQHGSLPLLIQELGVGGYDLQLITGIVECFRELSLTALVLHHVYPDRFAICSHHLASLLHITGATVPHYYVEYCRELADWSKKQWPTRGVDNVVDAEFALWTWYRLAYSGAKAEGMQHQKRFLEDPWIQQQRARRIAKSLGPIDRIDLARSYLETDPTVAAMIAWRELETTMRALIPRIVGIETFDALVERFSKNKTLPRDMDKPFFNKLWKQRNRVMHHGDEVAKGKIIGKRGAAEALEGGADILDGVAKFMEWSTLDV